MKYLATLAAAILLAGCTTAEDRTEQRLARWVEACGYSLEENPMLRAEEEAYLRGCVAALEDGYRTERAASASTGAAMVGLGATMMAPARPALTCTTSRGLVDRTVCR